MLLSGGESSRARGRGQRVFPSLGGAAGVQRGDRGPVRGVCVSLQRAREVREHRDLSEATSKLVGGRCSPPAYISDQLATTCGHWNWSDWLLGKRPKIQQPEPTVALAEEPRPPREIERIQF